MERRYAEVILPLALKGTFTYLIPDHLQKEVETGRRVEVQFGRNRTYSAVVWGITDRAPVGVKIKEIIGVIDERPIVQNEHLEFWQWVSEYYACSLGEVMNAALPGAMKLHSQTKMVQGFAIREEHDDLSDEEYLLYEALLNNNELNLDEARAIVGKKHIAKSMERLIHKGIAELKEELIKKFKPVVLKHLALHKKFRKNPKKALELTDQSEHQTNALLAILQKKNEAIIQSQLLENPIVKEHAIRALIKKGIVDSFEKEVSRVKNANEAFASSLKLSETQSAAIQDIQSQWEDKQVVLLHGVTGSGKTVLYQEFIKETINQGGQVLYLLPEIALTSQIINRIEKSIDIAVEVFHSRENIQKRVELWKAANKDLKMVIGARSSLFLPFKNLQLIIVDEEHDSSYKQQNPAPRYNARDAAIYLGHLCGAKVLLGTATPSIESYYNVRIGKFGYSQLKDRYGGALLPEIELVNLKKCREQKKMKGPFTNYLLENIEQSWRDQKQIILFQNRRGYAPSINCSVCSWTYQCHQCDVSLTYHKRLREMKCHYCNHTTAIPQECPACGSTRLEMMGFGTEKVEDELEILLPGIKTDRMDSDTSRSKKNLEKILYNFDVGATDVLIGTQMITKGLDFENVGLVGILNADSLFKFPDFRAGERGFQLLTQVSGRAGRRQSPGKVIIQTSNPEHPIITDVLNANFHSFYHRELKDRGKYRYPPFYRNFHLQINHKDLNTLWKAARLIRDQLKKHFGNRLLGPTEPMVPRVRNFFLLDFMLKVEKNAEVLKAVKEVIDKTMDQLTSRDPFKSVRHKLDVDPY